MYYDRRRSQTQSRNTLLQARSDLRASKILVHGGQLKVKACETELLTSLKRQGTTEHTGSYGVDFSDKKCLVRYLSLP